MPAQSSMEPFRQYKIPEKDWSVTFSSDMTFPCIETTPYQIIEPFDYTRFVPYQLDLHNTGLFPEFLYHFNKNFARIDDTCMGYVYLSNDEFSKKWTGPKSQETYSILLIENFYSGLFKKCLGPDLSYEVQGFDLRRPKVETEFRDLMIKEINSQSFGKRLKQLIAVARKGDPTMLVEFLMAFRHDEDFIWQMINVTYSSLPRGKKQEDFFEEEFNAASKPDPKKSTLRRVREFVTDLKYKEIVVSQQEPYSRKRRRVKYTAEEKRAYKQKKLEEKLALENGH